MANTFRVKIEVNHPLKDIVKTKKVVYQPSPLKNQLHNPSPGTSQGRNTALVSTVSEKPTSNQKEVLILFDPLLNSAKTNAEPFRGGNSAMGNLVQSPKPHPPAGNMSQKSRFQAPSTRAGNQQPNTNPQPLYPQLKNPNFPPYNPVQTHKPGNTTSSRHTPQTSMPPSVINPGNKMRPTNNSPQQQLGPPEISKITPELAKKISSDTKYIAPFFHQLNINQFSKQSSYTAQHDSGWNDSTLVRTTFSTRHVVRGLTPQSNLYKWDIIREWLTYLSNHCLKPNPKSMHMLMSTAILNYDNGVQNKTDFLNLTNPELAACMTTTIPYIVHHALKLPSLLASPIPFLKKYQNKTIYLTKKLACSLLANAFFCTLPDEKDGMQTINFHTMFNTASKGNAKSEKLKCILNYFQEMSKPGQDEKGNRIISFERRCVTKKVEWARSSKSLTQVEVEQRRKIEEARGMLKVDFANKRVGGGVMNEGAVMEEILFAACPELIVSRLFTEPLEDDEVLIITGAEQFSKYEGYSRSFIYAGPAKEKKETFDNLNRIYTPIVVMDALNFKEHEKETQFQKGPIDRELHKAYVAFLPNDGVNIPVATGNWGCGAFNGDPELKFLIQWMSASETGRKSMVYHTIGDARQSQSIHSMETFLKRKNVSVGDLYKVVVSYQKKRNKYPSVFEYVKSEFTKK